MLDSTMSFNAESPPKTIIIVDDTPANLRLLANLLSEQGYVVRLAPSGNLALMAIQHNLPDLILLDIRMPKMDGYEVCQRLKADDRTREIPIIFLSALQEGSNKTKAFEVGGADYITKPFQAEEVIARVRHQLQLVDLQQQLKQQQQQLLKQNQKLQQEIRDRKRIEAELVQEKTLLRSVVDAIPDLIFYQNPEGRYLLWNQAFKALTGFPSPEILYKTDDDLFSATFARQIQAKARQVLATQSPLRYEEWVTFPDQAQRLLETYRVPVQSPSGELLGLLGICRDITQRKAAEDYLNRMTSRLATLIHNLQAGILVENEHRDIVLANQCFCNLFGIDIAPTNLVGLDCNQLMVQKAKIFAHPAQATQRTQEILRNRQPFTAEELLLADGRILERDYVPILSGDHFQGHLWQYRDVTARKANEQALRLILEVTAAKTGSEFFRSLVRSLAEVLKVKYVLISQRIGPRRAQSLAFWQKDHFGENREYDLTGTPCEKAVEGQIVFHAEDIQTHYPQNQYLIDWGVTSYLGVPITNSSDENVGHLAVLDDRPMPPDQPRELILKIFATRAGAELERQTFENEIQQARELADAANRAKSEFLASVSHELRTPLNTILGFTQLILGEGHIDSKTREYLDIVNRSGEHLLTLINDVLEMSKIEAGKVALYSQPFDLHALLQSLEDMFSLRAKAKNLELQISCASEVPRYIETDESKLRQVLINLLGNAVKFTQKGHVKLKVGLGLESTLPKDPTTTAISLLSTAITLSFTVTDTGPGIASEELKTLFDPFIQTRLGYQSQESTGLGLPISQRLVQLMGGTIQIQTTLGQGATFAFEIKVSPVIPSESKSAPQVHRGVKRLAYDQPNFRILVVEDHPANRRLLVRMLESVGFMVQTAEDGRAAIEQARTWHPHLIWMDIRMPNMDGYEATRQIKAIGLKPSPVIIALTASAFEEERARVLTAGCDDFVRKPFKASQLFQKIAQYLAVHYIYEPNLESTSGFPNAITTPAIALSQSAEVLKKMPQEWIQALQQAAIKGSDERILQLIKTLPPEQSALAQTIAMWAQNFQFDSVLELLQSE